MLQTVKIILTQNNEFDLIVQCIISDSEDARANEINIVFNNINRFGYNYHFVQDIKHNLKIGSLEIENYSNRKKQMIYKLSLLPLLYEGKMSKFDEFINDIKETEPEFQNHILLKKKKYFEEQSYNYDLLSDDCRSNSSLEAYNKNIKDYLCKKHGLPSINFISFIRNEALKIETNNNANINMNIRFKYKKSKFKSSK